MIEALEQLAIRGRLARRGRRTKVKNVDVPILGEIGRDRPLGMLA
jgi:hypothetical protein